MPRYFLHPYIKFTPKRIYLTSHEDRINDERSAKIAFNISNDVSNHEFHSIMAVGDDVDGAVAYGKEHGINIRAIEPFADSQRLISDSRAAGALFTHMLGRYLVLSGRNSTFNGLLYRIRVIIHPLEKAATDFTKDNAKQIMQTLRGSKIHHPKPSKVFVWVGRELTFNEIETLSFPSDGEVFS